jgi:hypothetical protein
MADRATKLQNALDKVRMLMLGTAVPIGFHFTAVLESGFDAQSVPYHGALPASPRLLLIICTPCGAPDIAAARWAAWW